MGLTRNEEDVYFNNKDWEKGIMLGDQSYYHPVFEEVRAALGIQIAEEIDNAVLKELPTNVLKKLIRKVQEELVRRR